jgi:hypothetical protein
MSAKTPEEPAKRSRSGPNIHHTQRHRKQFSTTIDPLALETAKAAALAAGETLGVWLEGAIYARAEQAEPEKK